MNLFSKIFGIIKPYEAKEILEKERGEYKDIKPKNLEEQALKLVGETIYKKIIKEYTEKQWGKDCKELPPEIIKRLPLRFIYDNNYFDDPFQGIPTKGYTEIFKKLLKGIKVELNTPYDKNMKAKKIIYTGKIDEFYNYKYGKLEYRYLTFFEKELNTDNYQGNAVVNYSSHDCLFTRTIEHKHFVFDTKSKHTIITDEHSNWGKLNDSSVSAYPVISESNKKLYNKYAKIKNDNIIFGGRLGSFKYLNMDETIKQALEISNNLKNNHGIKKD